MPRHILSGQLTPYRLKASCLAERGNYVDLRVVKCVSDNVDATINYIKTGYRHNPRILSARRAIRVATTLTCATFGKS